MKRGTRNTYRSTVSKLILFSVLLMVGILAFLQYYFLRDLVGGIITFVFGTFLLGLVYYKTRYEIHDNYLRVSSLFFQQDIDIFQISSLTWVTQNQTFTINYSFSLHKLRVVYGYGQHIDISPQNSDKFIDQLLAVNPMINYQVEPSYQD